MLDPGSGTQRHARTVGTPINDTVTMPWESGKEPIEKVVRPEALISEMSVVARSLAARRSTAMVAAIIFVAGAIALAPPLIAPGLYAMYQDRTLREQVIASLAAVRPLQRQIEQSWERFNS